jgi:hypothetical protein
MSRSVTTTRAICIALLVASVVACAEAEPRLKVGTTAVCCCVGEYPAQYLKSPSRRVPLHQPPWEGFGFFIRFPSTAPRAVTITHQLPGVPEKLGTSWRDLGYEPADAVDGLTAAPVEVRGGRWFTFSTEVGDPWAPIVIGSQSMEPTGRRLNSR